MKKTFHQFHIQAIYIRLACLLMFIVGIYLIVLSGMKLNILMGLVGLAPIVISLYAYIVTFNNRILFLDDTIKVTGNLGRDSEKIQFPDEISYSDIQNIKLIYANKNSIKKNLNSPNLGNLHPKLYFEIVLNNSKTKWLLISTFSKPQRIEMLNLINTKTGKNFNYDDIERQDSSFYKKHKNIF